jgi:hypothetical protein
VAGFPERVEKLLISKCCMALSKDFLFEGNQFENFRKLFEGCTFEHNRFIPNVVDDLSMNSKEAAADPALHALGL